VEEKTAFQKLPNQNNQDRNSTTENTTNSSNSHAPTPRCPECGSQRVWKDGLRYNPFGMIQRYLCRNCGYRFSHVPCKLSKPRRLDFTRTGELNIKSGENILAGWNRRGDLGNSRKDGLKSITTPGPKIRREPYNQYEAVKAMESRIQETAAGATSRPAPDQETIKGLIA
jgi:predicted RNA-binding Zn-ribbon protein involved in translation (DUF1610 family)